MYVLGGALESPDIDVGARGGGETILEPTDEPGLLFVGEVGLEL